MGLWLAKYIFTIAFALNCRNAKIQPNPDDYHLSWKVKGVFGEIETKNEREDGVLYRGIHIRTKEIYRTYAEIKIDEAYDLSKQYLYKNILTLPTGEDSEDIFKMRTAYQWTRWKDPHWLGGIEINFDTEWVTTRYEIDTNFADKYVSRISIELPLIYEEIWFVTPYFKFEDYDDDRIWKAGIEYGIDLLAWKEKKLKEKLEDGNNQ